MANYRLAAKIRNQKGKEAAKKLRKEDKIPAVFYSAKSDPIMLIVERTELKKIMKTAASENIIMELKIESGKGGETKMVMLKELQTDPIIDSYIHADFYEISMDKELTLNVPIRLINSPVGVTNGGILQHVRREMAISCLPDKLIEYIDVDVSGLDIGETLHISDINFPEGITTMLEGHLTIAVVNAPAVSAEVEEEEAEEIEGEEKETDEETEAETESES